LNTKIYFLLSTDVQQSFEINDNDSKKKKERIIILFILKNSI